MRATLVPAHLGAGVEVDVDKDAARLVAGHVLFDLLQDGVPLVLAQLGSERLGLLAHVAGEPVTLFSAADSEAGRPAAEEAVANARALLKAMKIEVAETRVAVGRAAEEIVFGRVTNGAANDLEKVTEIARAMVFEYGMSDVARSRTMRADNYALSEETKRMRDSEQARLTDHAYAEATRLLEKHRATLDRLASALLEKETIDRDEIGRAHV